MQSNGNEQQHEQRGGDGSAEGRRRVGWMRCSLQCPWCSELGWASSLQRNYDEPSGVFAAAEGLRSCSDVDDE
jgi:hypothetical protein